MRKAMLGLALLCAMAAGATAQAGNLSGERAIVHPIYWSGGYCGPRCQAHHWRQRERWEARRRAWHRHRWEERRYGYQAYPRY